MASLQDETLLYKGAGKKLALQTAGFSTTTSNFRCEYLEPWEGRLRFSCYSDSSREGRSWQLQGNEEMEEGIKGTSTFTIHTCPTQSQALSPREKTLCELQCGERRNHRATQSRIRASVVCDTHVPLKSMTQEWKHSSVSRWLGVLEAAEGAHDESVWIMMNLTQVGKILTD